MNPLFLNIALLAFAASISACSSDSPTPEQGTPETSLDAGPTQDIDSYPAPKLECQSSLDSLQSTDEITLVEGPLPCDNSDSDQVYCALWKATVQTPNAQSGPSEDTTLDDAVMPHNVVIAIRAPLDGSPCDNQWITLDSGGTGRGYAQTFGRVAPGAYEAGGSFGDDLIRSYNDDGYITMDISYECGELCSQSSVSGWAPKNKGGTGWAHNTGGTGYIGMSTRARALYEWAYANAGSNELCGHAHSSGTGRMMTALTRYGISPLFDTIVFDGGPVWTYFPWVCGGFEQGPLGPLPEKFSVQTGSTLFRGLYDCTRSTGDNTDSCNYSACADGQYDEEAYLDDSNLLRASHRDFASTDIHVVLGGNDFSPAPVNARLWLSGYSYQDIHIPGLTGASINVTQGYCEDESGEYGSRPCSDWNPTEFNGVSQTDVGFDARLVGVTHSTAEWQPAIEVLQEKMMSSCPAR